ncbi:VOC family protein [Herbaspirillum sp. NPDC101397]|uniref:VOC family protein n=1 Tax=Herbaspirillum sp. NPDC101397 TaxID=3364006 RepID=UPI00383B3353
MAGKQTVTSIPGAMMRFGGIDTQSEESRSNRLHGCRQRDGKAAAVTCPCAEDVNFTVMHLRHGAAADGFAIDEQRNVDKAFIADNGDFDRRSVLQYRPHEDDRRSGEIDKSSPLPIHENLPRRYFTMSDIYAKPLIRTGRIRSFTAPQLPFGTPGFTVFRTMPVSPRCSLRRGAFPSFTNQSIVNRSSIPTPPSFDQPQAALDHLVINTHYDIDAAQGLLEGLGFIVTPRGYHTLGSVNHLVVLPGGYLELIGQPRDSDKVRQEILDSPVGIDGLVYAVDDIDACHARWLGLGLDAQPVQHFSRPVEVAEKSVDARFSTVRLRPGQFAAGRVYACRHLTPELVWRPEWMAHANGVQGIAGMLVIDEDPVQAAASYQRLGGWGPDFALEFADANSLAVRFGELAAHAPQREAFFAAIRFRGGDRGLISARARALGLPVREDADKLEVALPAFRTLLEFAG